MFSLEWLAPRPFCASRTRDVSCFDCVVYVGRFSRVLLIVYFLPKDKDGMGHPTITIEVEGANLEKIKGLNISMLDLD